MKRRDFLKNTSLASTAFMVPAFLQGRQGLTQMNSRSGKILIVVQLSGGNDGLNTFVPYQNDLYYQKRPILGIKKDKVLRVSDEIGFNPALSGLRDLYDEGLISIINGVGYPNPDRSHFRSMDIWQTASDSNQYMSSGWLGRYLDNQCHGCELPYHALEVDDTLSLALKGELKNGFATGDPNLLYKTNSNQFLKKLSQSDTDHEHEAAAYLYKTMIDSQASAQYLYDQSRKVKTQTKYPSTPFGRDLKQISELITADTDTRIYYVSLTGFDTHVNQMNKHARLLEQYADGMKALVSDLKKHDLLEDTLIMTFSEFGRRVKQNASNGTDHGTANNLILIGGKLRKPGFYNDPSDLSKLDKGDLIYQVDFRNVYASILDDWLEGDARKILNSSYKKLKII